jgi:hypothetical protein
LASFWVNNSGTNSDLFTLTAPTGSIIDITLDMIYKDDPTLGPVIVVATATLGQVYFLALDCVTNTGAPKYPPVSLTTTV